MRAMPQPGAGKSFFKKKKQPVPVRLVGKDWASQIRKACEATYLFWSGACWHLHAMTYKSGLHECFLE